MATPTSVTAGASASETRDSMFPESTNRDRYAIQIAQSLDRLPTTGMQASREIGRPCHDTWAERRPRNASRKLSPCLPLAVGADALMESMVDDLPRHHWAVDDLMHGGVGIRLDIVWELTAAMFAPAREVIYRPCHVLFWEGFMEVTFVAGLCASLSAGLLPLGGLHARRIR